MKIAGSNVQVKADLTEVVSQAVENERRKVLMDVLDILSTPSRDESEFIQEHIDRRINKAVSRIKAMQ